MTWPAATRDILDRLADAQQQLTDQFVDRDEAVKLMALAAVCGEHLLLVGPPGTGKTDLVSRFTRLIQANTFQYLITRFTEPSEVFGPLDLGRFHKGEYHIATRGMLPEAEVAFLDEVFQGNSAILNGFLALVNERVFHNGAVQQEVPLVTLIGATNDLPDDPALRAFADRFLLRAVVADVPPDRTAALLARGWEHETARIKAGGRTPGPAFPPLTVADLRHVRECLPAVTIPDEVRAELAAVVTELRGAGAEVSDRRAVRGQKLVAAAALLRRADRVAPQDFWPLRHVWTRLDDQATLDQVLGPRLAAGGAPTGPPVRPAQQVADELARLDADSANATDGTQITALLSRYNTIRREIARHHPGNAGLGGRVRNAIERLMTRLGRSE